MSNWSKEEGGGGGATHAGLPDVTPDQHHSQDHAPDHASGGGDVITAAMPHTVQDDVGIDVGTRRKIQLRTITGAITYVFIDDAGGDRVRVTIDHATGFILPNAHHNQAHSVSGGDHSGTLALAQFADNIITLAKLVDIATARILGRVTAGSGDIEELTGTQATTLLDLFTSALKGLVPASGGGTVNFLRADGTWSPPGGASGNTLYARGSFTVATGNFDQMTKNLTLTSTQRGTLQGTGRLAVYN